VLLRDSKFVKTLASDIDANTWGVGFAEAILIAECSLNMLLHLPHAACPILPSPFIRMLVSGGPQQWEMSAAYAKHA
jgi:hypothetical protein